MRRLASLFVPLSLLLACDPGASGTKDAGTDTGTGDSVADADADTDADSDTDTGKGEDTSKDTDTGGDTDTGPDDMSTDYTGATRLVIVVADDNAKPEDSAGVYLLEPGTKNLTAVGSLSVRADAHVGCAGDSVWAMQGFNDAGKSDEMIRINPETGAVISTWSLGSQRDPRAIEKVGDNWWIADWGKSRLQTFTSAGTEGALIDLAAYADSDGRPEPVAFAEEGDHVYVVLANFTTVGQTYNTGHVVKIESSTGTVLADYPTLGMNPDGTVWRWGTNLYIVHQSTVTPLGIQMDGGVERVDISGTSTSGWVLDETGVTAITDIWLAHDLQDFWIATPVLEPQSKVEHRMLDGSALQNWTAPVGLVDMQFHETHFFGAEDHITQDWILERDGVTGSVISDLDLPGRVQRMTLCEAYDADSE